MGAGSSTYSGGSSGSFSFEPQFSPEYKRRSRWDPFEDTICGSSSFPGGASMPDLGPRLRNQAFSTTLGMDLPTAPNHGTLSGGAFYNSSPALGPHFSGPGLISPLGEPLFDPTPSFHLAAFDIPCRGPREGQSFCSAFESSKDQDESAIRPTSNLMQDSHLGHIDIIEKQPQPAPILQTGTTPPTCAFSSQPTEIFDIEHPWKFAAGIFPTTNTDQLLKHGRLGATSVLQAEGNDSSIRVQQDFSLLPNPKFGKMESSVAFNKLRTGTGLKVSSRGLDTVDTLWISDTSLLSSPSKQLGLSPMQLSGDLSRLHDGSILDPVERYVGNGSLNVENISHSVRMSNSVTGMTNPGILFIDNRATFTVNSGYTELNFGSHYDVFERADTVDLGIRHKSRSDNIAKTLGVDSIDLKGKIAGEVRVSPMTRNLVALDLAVEGSKTWNKGSQTSAAVETDLYSRRFVVKGRHTETIKNVVNLEVQAELSPASQSSKRIAVSIKPIIPK